MKVALALLVLLCFSAVIASEVHPKGHSSSSSSHTGSSSSSSSSSSHTGSSSSSHTGSSGSKHELSKELSQKVCNVAKGTFGKDTGSIWTNKNGKKDESTMRKAKKGQHKSSSSHESGQTQHTSSSSSGKSSKMFMLLEVGKRRRSSSSGSSSSSSSSSSVEIEIAHPKKEDQILAVNQEGPIFKLGKYIQTYFEKHKNKQGVVRVDTKNKSEKIDINDNLKADVNIWDSDCNDLLWPKEHGSGSEHSSSSSGSEHSSSSSGSEHSSSSSGSEHSSSGLLKKGKPK